MPQFTAAVDIAYGAVDIGCSTMFAMTAIVR